MPNCQVHWNTGEGQYYINIHEISEPAPGSVGVGELIHTVGPCSTKAEAQRQAKEHLDGAASDDEFADSAGI